MSARFGLQNNILLKIKKFQHISFNQKKLRSSEIVTFLFKISSLLNNYYVTVNARDPNNEFLLFFLCKGNVSIPQMFTRTNQIQISFVNDLIWYEVIAKKINWSRVFIWWKSQKRSCVINQLMFFINQCRRFEPILGSLSRLNY